MERNFQNFENCNYFQKSNYFEKLFWKILLPTLQNSIIMTNSIILKNSKSPWNTSIAEGIWKTLVLLVFALNPAAKGTSKMCALAPRASQNDIKIHTSGVFFTALAFTKDIEG